MPAAANIVQFKMVLFFSRTDQRNKGLGDITVYMLRDLSLMKTQLGKAGRGLCLEGHVAVMLSKSTFQPVGWEIDG